MHFTRYNELVFTKKWIFRLALHVECLDFIPVEFLELGKLWIVRCPLHVEWLDFISVEFLDFLLLSVYFISVFCFHMSLYSLIWCLNDGHIMECRIPIVLVNFLHSFFRIGELFDWLVVNSNSILKKIMHTIWSS